jgi:hypothetical protein
MLQPGYRKAQDPVDGHDRQDFCTRPSTVPALSQCCQEGCGEDVILTMQDYCIRPGTAWCCHNTVIILSRGCQEAGLMTVQDYCVRPGTHCVVTVLSKGC